MSLRDRKRAALRFMIMRAMKDYLDEDDEEL